MGILVNPNISPLIPYLPGKPIENVKKEFGLSTVVKLASNENPFGPSSQVKSIITQAINEINLYPDGAAVDLKSALSVFYQCPSDYFMIGNGSDELLALIALTYLNPFCEALISEGTFSEYYFAARLANSCVTRIALNDFTYNLDAFAHKLSAKTKVVFLCNPNNPTGTYFSQTVLEKFLNQVDSTILVVLDEAYHEYADAPDYPNSLLLLSRYPNLIILRTFSKVYGLAGLRIGYAISAPDIIAALNKVREPFNVNRLAQVAGIAALADQAHVRQTVLHNLNEKIRFYQQLEQLKLAFLPSQGNFILIHTPKSGEEIFQSLLKRGLIIRPLNGFGFPKSIRVTLGLTEENNSFFYNFKEVLSNGKANSTL